MRTIRISSVLALVGAFFVVPSPISAAPACASNWVEVYAIDFETDKSTYRMGDAARITVTVTDATTGAPVADTDVAVGVLTDNESRYSTKATRTNDDGRAKATFRLVRPGVVPGWAELRARAYKYYDEGDPACAGLGLYGYSGEKKAFYVKK